MIIIISMIMIMISMIRIKLVVRTLTDHLTLWTVLCLFNKSLVPIIHIIIIINFNFNFNFKFLFLT